VRRAPGDANFDVERARGVDPWHDRAIEHPDVVEIGAQRAEEGDALRLQAPARPGGNTGEMRLQVPIPRARHRRLRRHRRPQGDDAADEDLDREDRPAVVVAPAPAGVEADRLPYRQAVGRDRAVAGELG
jgi:hypothetical protein